MVTQRTPLGALLLCLLATTVSPDSDRHGSRSQQRVKQSNSNTSPVSETAIFVRPYAGQFTCRYTSEGRTCSPARHSTNSAAASSIEAVAARVSGSVPKSHSLPRISSQSQHRPIHRERERHRDDPPERLRDYDRERDPIAIDETWHDERIPLPPDHPNAVSHPNGEFSRVWSNRQAGRPDQVEESPAGRRSSQFTLGTPAAVASSPRNTNGPNSFMETGAGILREEDVREHHHHEHPPGASGRENVQPSHHSVPSLPLNHFSHYHESRDDESSVPSHDGGDSYNSRNRPEVLLPGVDIRHQVPAAPHFQHRPSHIERGNHFRELHQPSSVIDSSAHSSQDVTVRQRSPQSLQQPASISRSRGYQTSIPDHHLIQPSGGNRHGNSQAGFQQNQPISNPNSRQQNRQPINESPPVSVSRQREPERDYVEYYRPANEREEEHERDHRHAHENPERVDERRHEDRYERGYEAVPSTRQRHPPVHQTQPQLPPSPPPPPPPVVRQPPTTQVVKQTTTTPVPVYYDYVDYVDSQPPSNEQPKSRHDNYPDDRGHPRDLSPAQRQPDTPRPTSTTSTTTTTTTTSTTTTTEKPTRKRDEYDEDDDYRYPDSYPPLVTESTLSSTSSSSTPWSRPVPSESPYRPKPVRIKLKNNPRPPQKSVSASASATSPQTNNNGGHRRNGGEGEQRGGGRRRHRTTTTTAKPEDDYYDNDYYEDEYYDETTTTTRRPRGRGRQRGGRRRSTTTTTTTTTTLSPGYKPRPDGRVIDYAVDPNFPRELNGADLTNYPFYITIPTETIDFNCKGRHDGYYAGIKQHCQIYHHCAIGNRYDFLCPNYTLFDQTTFTCRFINTVDCPNSEKHFNRNDDLYLESTTPSPPESSKKDEKTGRKRRSILESDPLEESRPVLQRAVDWLTHMLAAPYLVQ